MKGSLRDLVVEVKGRPVARLETHRHRVGLGPGNRLPLDDDLRRLLGAIGAGCRTVARVGRAVEGREEVQPESRPHVDGVRAARIADRLVGGPDQVAGIPAVAVRRLGAIDLDLNPPGVGGFDTGDGEGPDHLIDHPIDALAADGVVVEDGRARDAGEDLAGQLTVIGDRAGQARRLPRGREPATRDEKQRDGRETTHRVLRSSFSHKGTTGGLFGEFDHSPIRRSM